MISITLTNSEIYGNKAPINGGTKFFTFKMKDFYTVPGRDGKDDREFSNQIDCIANSYFAELIQTGKRFVVVGSYSYQKSVGGLALNITSVTPV